MARQQLDVAALKAASAAVQLGVQVVPAPENGRMVYPRASSNFLNRSDLILEAEEAVLPVPLGDVYGVLGAAVDRLVVQRILDGKDETDGAPVCLRLEGEADPSEPDGFRELVYAVDQSNCTLDGWLMPPSRNLPRRILGHPVRTTDQMTEGSVLGGQWDSVVLMIADELEVYEGFSTRELTARLDARPKYTGSFVLADLAGG